MKTLFIVIAIAAAGASTVHATDRCTDAQWKEALSNAPTRDGSKLVAKTALQPNGDFTVQVYDAEQESYPLVCERQFSVPSVAEISIPAHRAVLAASSPESR